MRRKRRRDEPARSCARRKAISVAETLLRDANERTGKVLDPTDSLREGSAHNLGIVLRQTGRFDEAEKLYLQILEAEDPQPGSESLSALTTMNELGQLYLDTDRLDEAESLLERVLAGRRRILGSDDPSTLVAINNVAEVYRERGRFKEAERLFVERLGKDRARFGAEHPDTLWSISDMGFLLQAQGKFAEAEPLLEQALRAGGRSWERASGHARHAGERRELARVDGPPAEAEALRGGSGRPSQGSDPTIRRRSRRRACSRTCTRTRRKPAQAESRCTGRCSRDDARSSVQASRAARGLRDFAKLYADAGRWAEAEPLAKELVDSTPADSKALRSRKKLLERIEAALQNPK